jgi:hypothetical protein
MKRILPLLLMFLSCWTTPRPAHAQSDDPPDTQESTARDWNPDESDGEKERLKPTQVGVRFTPQMASAMSKKFLQQMKPKYDLDDQQSEAIQGVMQRELMRFARENEKLGRDMIEMMMATMIEHDGRFPKEQAQEFAKLARQFTPKLKDFFTRSAAEIGQHMTMKQRLAFTADVGVAAAGMVVFENRMKRWEEGKIGDFANPFFDPADNDPAKAEPEPQDPSEPKEHRETRKMVEAWVTRQSEKDLGWEKYLESATKYYGFTETQSTAAAAILKDCRERAAVIKSTQWKTDVKNNRISLHLSYRMGGDAVSPVWISSLEREYERLLRPMEELDAEFKRRIDALADSTQRAEAREKIRKILAEKGLRHWPGD